MIKATPLQLLSISALSKSNISPTTTSRGHADPPKTIRTAIFFFAMGIVVFHIQSKVLLEIDCVPAPYMAWIFAKSANFDLRPCRYLEKHLGTVVLENSKGEWVSKYPPGSAITALPVFAPIAFLRTEPPDPGTMRTLGKIVAVICCSLAGALVYLTCLKICPNTANVTTILFLFGTPMFSTASQSLWMHGPATMWLSLALWLLVGNESISIKDPKLHRTMLLAGLALGMAVLCRPTVVLFLIGSLVAFTVRRRFIASLTLLAGALFPLSILAWYNLNYFQDPVSAGYGSEASQWSTPIWLGATGLLLSPSKGLLIYCPALALVVWSFCRFGSPFARSIDASDSLSTFTKSLLMWWMVAGFGTILLYGKWHCWWGGWCYGPRFLCETMPIWCLMFGIVASQLSSRMGRESMNALVACSILIQVAGVFGHHREWNQRHDLPDQGRSMWNARDSQIVANFRVMLGKITSKSKKQIQAAQITASNSE